MSSRALEQHARCWATTAVQLAFESKANASMLSVAWQAVIFHLVHEAYLQSAFVPVEPITDMAAAVRDNCDATTLADIGREVLTQCTSPPSCASKALHKALAALQAAATWAHKEGDSSQQSQPHQRQRAHAEYLDLEGDEASDGDDSDSTSTSSASSHSRHQQPPAPRGKRRRVVQDSTSSSSDDERARRPSPRHPREHKRQRRDAQATKARAGERPRRKDKKSWSIGKEEKRLQKNRETTQQVNQRLARMIAQNASDSDSGAKSHLYLSQSSDSDGPAAAAAAARHKPSRPAAAPPAAAPPPPPTTQQPLTNVFDMLLS